MRNLSAASILLTLGLASAALAQQQVGPVNPTICAYNSSPFTITSGNYALVQCDVNGNFLFTPSNTTPTQVVGNVASGATDAGNPVKIGGVANSSIPTAVTAGQRVNDWRSLNGATVIAGYIAAATDGASNTLGYPANPAGAGNNAWSAAGFVFNGATWDRTRSMPSSDAQASTGFAATGTMLFNGSNYDRWKDVGGSGDGGLAGIAAGAAYFYNGSTWDRPRAINGAAAAGTGTQATAIAPTSTSAAGITSVVSASAESGHVLKASAGNLYSVYATNLTATAGFLAVVNSTTVPSDGAVTPLECVPLPGNGNATINYNPGPAAVFSTGISAFVTSATTCFTKTTGVITAFIKGSVQ